MSALPFSKWLNFCQMFALAWFLFCEKMYWHMSISIMSWLLERRRYADMKHHTECISRLFRFTTNFSLILDIHTGKILLLIGQENEFELIIASVIIESVVAYMLLCVSVLKLDRYSRQTYSFPLNCRRHICKDILIAFNMLFFCNLNCKRVITQYWKKKTLAVWFVRFLFTM